MQAETATTKTLKLKGGKTMQVPLHGYSAGLSEDSMKGSDDEELFQAIGSKCRRKVLTKRKGTAKPRLKTPPLRESVLIKLLAPDGFDISAWHRKPKARRKTDCDPLEPKAASTDEEEEEDGEDGESETSSRRTSPVRISRPSTSSARPPDDNKTSTTGTLKRQSSANLTETESENERPETQPESVPKGWIRRTRFKYSHSPSATESEPESASQAARHPPQTRTNSQPAEDTESEDESAAFTPKFKPVDPVNDPLRPRPAFKATAEQQKRGPLILDEKEGIQVPRCVAMYLRPYQEDGVKFFWDRHKEGRGGVLGDDMGLGKTIQVISFLSAIMQKSGNKSDAKRRYNWVDNYLDTHKIIDLPPANSKWPTCLIVAPKTVVGNWERELATWTYMEFGVFTGTPAEREDILKSFTMGRYDVLLISHDSARLNIARLQSLAFSCIFVDEAHKIKNDKTQTAKAYNQFDCLVRFGLTGTMIQNSYGEMWPLLNWSNPGALGSEKEWTRYVVRPMQEGQARNVAEKEVLQFRHLAERLHTLVMPLFFLRRTKDIIQDQLPKKTDHVVFCPLTDTQVAVYERFLDTEDVQLMLGKDIKCDCDSGKKRGVCCYTKNAEGVPWRKLLFKYIDIFIKISNNLLLIYPGPDDLPEQVTRNRKLMKVAFPDGDGGTYATALANKDLCGKWEALERLLKLWKKDPKEKNKVLIFSKSVKLLDFLSMWLGASGFTFRQLDGKVKQEDRFKLIDDFNLNPDVYIFLISTLTGGTGLNLVAANKVVIFDPNWNPAHDLQAMDRAYRFGQQRDVFVYRLLGAGSLEELVYARQLYKQQQMRIGYDGSHQTRLFTGVQGNKVKQGELFGLANILKLRKDLSTKLHIEEAFVENLDWALANTEVAHDVDEETSQLGGFLLDEAVPVSKKPKQLTADENKIFDGTGIKYTHLNDDLLRDNHVEAKIVTELRSKRRNPRKSSTNSDTPVSWPPKRPHHRDIAEQRLSSRRDAIIAAGYDVATYAQEFVVLTPEQQAIRLQELDAPRASTSTTPTNSNL